MIWIPESSVDWTNERGGNTDSSKDENVNTYPGDVSNVPPPIVPPVNGSSSSPSSQPVMAGFSNETIMLLAVVGIGLAFLKGIFK